MNTEQIQAATPWTVGEVRSPGGVDWDIVLRDADNSPIAFVRVAGWTKKRAIAHANSIVNAVNSYEAREALIGKLVGAIRDFLQAIDSGYFGDALVIGPSYDRAESAYLQDLRAALAAANKVQS